MFKKILIANRGEIACRVIKTARRMGIGTVAVFSEADRQALHLEMADEAVFIGPPAASESYLVIEKIIAACRDTGADAVHPGYGFLSEREAFPRALAEAVMARVPALIAALPEPNRAAASAAWRDHAEVVLCDSAEDMAAHADDRAPEHLHVQARDLDWAVCRPTARCSWASGPPWPSATRRRGRTMSCPPPGPRATRGGCRCTSSSRPSPGNGSSARRSTISPV